MTCQRCEELDEVIEDAIDSIEGVLEGSYEENILSGAISSLKKASKQGERNGG